MLALWEFFWDEPTDWVPGVPTPTPVVQDPGSGGGGRKNRQRGYRRVGEDFWLVRERYLRRFVSPLVPGQPVDQNEKPPRPAGDEDTSAQIASREATESGRLLLLEQARQSALLRAKAANSAVELLALSARIRQLTLDINKERQQNYDLAMTILLLDIF